jgi:hypothetical protein
LIDPVIKLFPADKNYILKEAQTNLKDELIELAAYRIINAYLTNRNSLGLVDEFVDKLTGYKFESNAALESMYRDMAGYFRYHNADNQLELLFDGESHSKKFSIEWKKIFLNWIDEFCLKDHFHKALLGATVFYPGANGEILLESRIRTHLHKHFNLKTTRYRGVRKIVA